MKNYVWLSAGLALMAAVLVAGCGGGGSTTSAAGTTAGGSASTSSSSTTTAASGDATPDDVYNACLDALNGVGNQQIVQQGCSQARDAFQQCATAASNAPEGSARDTALKACQDAANKTVAQLQASP
jgi:hypothetical protein